MHWNSLCWPLLVGVAFGVLQALLMVRRTRKGVHDALLPDITGLISFCLVSLSLLCMFMFPAHCNYQPIPFTYTQLGDSGVAVETFQITKRSEMIALAQLKEVYIRRTYSSAGYIIDTGVQIDMPQGAAIYPK